MDCQNLKETAKKLGDQQKPERADANAAPEDRPKHEDAEKAVETESAIEDQFDNMPV